MLRFWILLQRYQRILKPKREGLMAKFFSCIKWTTSVLSFKMRTFSAFVWYYFSECIAISLFHESQIKKYFTGTRRTPQVLTLQFVIYNSALCLDSLVHLGRDPKQTISTLFLASISLWQYIEFDAIISIQMLVISDCLPELSFLTSLNGMK